MQLFDISSTKTKHLHPSLEPGRDFLTALKGILWWNAPAWHRKWGEQRPCSFCTLLGHVVLQPSHRGVRTSRPQGDHIGITDKSLSWGPAESQTAQPLPHSNHMRHSKWEPPHWEDSACRTMAHHGKAWLVVMCHYFRGGLLHNSYRLLVQVAFTCLSYRNKRIAWMTGLHEFHRNIYCCTWMACFCILQITGGKHIGAIREITSRHVWPKDGKWSLSIS